MMVEMVWQSKGAASTPDLYRAYRKDGGELTPSQYRKVLYALNKAIITAILIGWDIKLGALGVICVRKIKSMNTLNYKYFKETGIKVPYANLETNGYSVKFHWAKKDFICKKELKKFYSFVATRTNKRNLSEAFKKDFRRYITRE